ncbi:MAG: neutral zinc metallopeptidase [Candidatus Kapabacteria bacterium]|nr:neutral zinc metallopeptidase [Candidatus Kapabacteria bacterium]
MKWRGRRESDNVEDIRDGGGGFAGRGGGLPFGGRGAAVGGGLGTIVIVIIVMLMGGDPTQFLQGGGGMPQQVQQQQQPRQRNAGEDELASFVKVVLADNEDVWQQLMQDYGHAYRFPRLVLFSRSVHSGCGTAGSETGPFYCPADEKVYIDLTFYDEMRTKFKASGDFAMAYVVAHEVGHHIQHVLGISDQVHRAQQRLSKAEANRLSVKLELQADFLAGVWAHHAQKMKDVVEQGDIEEALTTAAAIGDDRLQMMGQGYVQPESFTHGSSKERMYWFKRGYESGNIRDGDTFGNGSL